MYALVDSTVGWEKNFDLQKMAANRKLVQLVDSTLRKVEEGLQEFNDMWLKVEECTNPNQRVRRTPRACICTT